MTGDIQISAEAIGGILFAIGAILTAYGYWLRARAKKIEAEAEQVKATAIERVNNSTAERNERQAIVDTLKQYSDLLRQQITINQQHKERADQMEATYQKRLADKEARDEANYHTLQQLQDRHHAETHGVLKRRFDTLDETLAALPAKLQEDNKAWVGTLVGELVAQLADRFAELTLSQEWYPFPDATDPEWREEFVKPLVGKVRVYRRPVLSDTSLMDVTLMAEGENIEVIQGRKKGWLVVRLLREKRAYYGWLPEHEVLTGLTAVRKTSEMAAVTVPAGGTPA